MASNKTRDCLSTWHHDGFRCCMDSSDRCARSKEYFNKMRHLLDLDNVISCQSVGPACGDVDIHVLKLMPKCQRYYGVEPDVKAADILETALAEQVPQIQANIARNLVQNDVGPSEPVDLILVQHCLYYLSEEDTRCLCVKLGYWTKPGGHIAVAHSTRRPGKSIFQDAQLQDYIRDESCDHLAVLKEGLLGTFDIISDEMVVQSTSLKARNPLLASFLAGRLLDKKQVDEFYDFMAGEYPDGYARPGERMIIFQKQ